MDYMPLPTDNILFKSFHSNVPNVHTSLTYRKSVGNIILLPTNKLCM